MGSTQLVDYDGDFTWCAGFNLTETSDTQMLRFRGGDAMYIVVGYDDGLGPTELGYAAHCAAGGWTGAVGGTVGTTVTQNRFIYFCAVRDKTKQSLAAYVNGTLGTNASCDSVNDLGYDSEINRDADTESWCIDEMYMWDRTLTTAEIVALSDDVLAGVAFLPVTTTINFPENGVRNNSIPLTVGFQSNKDGACSLYVNETWINSTSVTANTEAFLNYSTTTNQQEDFFVNVSCNDTTDTSIANITVLFDSVPPSITPVTGNDFSADNTSAFMAGTIVGLNFSFADEFLNDVLVNVTYASNGTIIYQNENLSLSKTAFNVNTTIDTTGFDEGNISVNTQASDDNTLLEIPYYDIWKNEDEKYIEYYPDSGNFIKVETPETKSEVKSFSTTKLKDRYIFEYEFTTTATKRVFKLYSYQKIVQNPKRGYGSFTIGHFGKGNWVDFKVEGLSEKDYQVEKISDYIYQITITSDKTYFKFESIGGLNLAEKDFIFAIDNTEPFISGESNRTTAGSKEIFATDNVSVNATILDNSTIDTVLVSHNDSGAWINSTTTSVKDNIYNFTIYYDQLSADEVVGWFYCANDSAGNEACGNLQEFQVSNTPPTRPILLSPPNNSETGNRKPVFTWTNATDDGTGVTHHIVISNESDFSNIIKNETVSVSYTPDQNMNVTRYYWYVYANDSSNQFNKSKDFTFLLSTNFNLGDDLRNISRTGEVVINSSFEINVTIPKYSTMMDSLLVLTKNSTNESGFEDNFENRASSLLTWSIIETAPSGTAKSDVTQGLSDNNYQLNTTTAGAADATQVIMYANRSDMRLVTSAKMILQADEDGNAGQPRAFLGISSDGNKQSNTFDILNSLKNYTKNITVNRTSTLTDVWGIHNGSESIGTIDTSGLNDSSNWTITFISSTKNNGVGDGSVFFSVYDVNISPSSDSLENITVDINGDEVYYNSSRLSPGTQMSIKLKDGFQDCIDQCSIPVVFECLCTVNITSDADGTADYDLNLSYYPYQTSFEPGTFEELTNRAYGLKLPRIPNSTDLTDVNAAFQIGSSIGTPTKSIFSDRYEFNITTSFNVDQSMAIDHRWLFNRTFLNGTMELVTTFNNSQNFTTPLIDLCTNPATNLSFLNLTFSDEETLTLLDSNLDISFEGFYKEGDFTTTNVSFNLTDINNVSFCFDSEQSARYDILMVYDSSGYTQRIYNFLDDLNSTNTTVLPLYLSDDGNLTNIFITLFDENSNRLANYYVKMDRFYPALNEYRNIETVKSDINGETLFHLIPLSVEYRIRIFDFGGTLVKQVARTTIKSTDVSITVPTEDSPFSDFDDAQNAVSSLSYDNATQEVLWQSSSEVYPQSCLQVVRLSSSGEVLYNNCQTGINVVDNYIITENVSDEQYSFRGYFITDEGSIISGTFLEIDNTRPIFGQLGLLLTLVITVTLFMVGIRKPSVAIALSTLGLLVSVYLRFIILGFSTVVLLIIMVAYLIYKMKD